MKILAVILAVLSGSTALAQEPDTNVPLPQQRPDNSDAEPPVEAATGKPARIYQTACPAMLDGLIEAEMLPPLHEKSCGLQTPLLVRAVFAGKDRIALSSPVTTNCQMAATLAHWVKQISDYAKAVYNQPVTTVVTGTSYMCRPRNNQPGADLSEHAFANAVDVTGFEIGNSQKVGLPAHWNKKTPEGRMIRFAHAAACSQFTTVLGPDANKLHRDHLHLDLGCHGKACSYRLCE